MSPRSLTHSSRWFYASVAIVACLILSPVRSAADQAASPPNVLFIAVDDLKPLIGAFGDEHAVTPHMDRLAARGIAFLNAHCQQAVCAPSRVSLLTGLRPDTTKVWDLKTQFRAALPDVVTLPQRFKQAGYDAVGMGMIYDPRSAGGRNKMDEASWSEPFHNIDAPASRTFSYLNPQTVATIEARRAEITDMPKRYDLQLKAIFPDGKPSTDRADVPDNAYHDGAMTDVAVERLGEYRDNGKPFFLAVGFKKPHLPFNAPEQYWQLYDRDALPVAEYTQAPEGAPDFATQPGWELRTNYDAPREGEISMAKQRELIHGYYAATSYIDAQVGRLLDALEANGQNDNTIVVLWGDHGWHLGDHDIWCKHTNYEQATRSPLIVAAPGIGRAGTKSLAPVEFVDIYPTLLDLASLEAAGELHGVSLRPIMDDPSVWVKDIAVSQYPRGGGKNAWMGYAFRSDRYRLVQWYAMNAKKGDTQGPLAASELYDYETDPLETRNLIDDPAYAEVRADMEVKAERYRSAMSSNP
ncbi:MAG: sulfatase [Planctomycetota bacterium]